MAQQEISMLLILNVGKGKVINLGKVMVLSFTDDEEDIYRGILNIVNGSNNFEQYNILQNIKLVQEGALKIDFVQRSVLVNDIEIELTYIEFEILCLLKSHGRYNLEIAEELQLTPATASHHMSMLLANHMVAVEKKDGRVYYQLNQGTLREIMECFEEFFL